MDEQLDLVGTIAVVERFSTFANLLDISKAAEMITDAGGEFTVFVPTNDAFARLPEGVLDELLTPERLTDLKEFVAFHILPGKMIIAAMSGDHVNKRTVAGKVFRLVEPDGTRVDGAEVQARNIAATNGIVHAIDTVLSPPIAAGLRIEHANVVTAVRGNSIL